MRKRKRKRQGSEEKERVRKGGKDVWMRKGRGKEGGRGEDRRGRTNN